MDTDSTARFRPIASAAAFVGSLLIVVTVVDFVMTVWPLRPGAVVWRYGAAGLLGGFLLSPLLGIAMVMTAAAICGWRGVQRAVMFTSLLGGLLLAIALVGFGLDALQVRGGLAEDRKATFDVGVVKAAFKHVTAVLALGWLSFAARHSLAQMAAGTERSRKGAGPLVVGETGRGN